MEVSASEKKCIILSLKFTNHQQIFISSGSKWIIVGASTGSVLFILICILWFCWRRRKRRKYANLQVQLKSSSIGLIFMGKKLKSDRKVGFLSRFLFSRAK